MIDGKPFGLVHPLVERLVASRIRYDQLPACIPFDSPYADTDAPITDRPIFVTRDDLASYAVLAVETRSFRAALDAGLQLPRELLNSLRIRETIGRVRYELAVTDTAFIITRRYYLVDEYTAFMATMASDFPSGKIADLDPNSGLLDHGDDLSLCLDTTTIAEGGAISSRAPGGRA